MAETFAKSERLQRLSELLAERPDWPLRDRLVLVERLARQVQALHQNGRIHRAIAIGQVTVDSEFRPQLPPPGGPRPFGGDDSDAAFCPPELTGDAVVMLPAEADSAAAALRQAGHAVDPRRVDVYQLGVLACEMVTGRPLLSYIYDATIKARIPAVVQPLLERSLGFDSPDRFQSCDGFLAALAEALRQTAVLDVPAAARETPAEGSRAPSGNTPSRGTKQPLAARSAQAPAFERLGHYRIIEQIGGGGMGDVYRAYDESLQRPAAIKVLPPQLARDSDFVRRFHAEATAVASLSHPNVVPVYFIGEENGYHFFAMQYVEGESLAERLGREKRLPVDEALRLIAQCLAGLQAAHALGLVHRDVKPGNILLERPSGRAMLVDFGLVRRLNQSAAMTATGVILGTVDYIAPEQARGFPVDGRTDIYSAGVLLYQLLSGRMPFTADTPTAMVFQHAYEKPFPLDEAMPGLPLSVRQIVERMMAKDPSRRYADCAAVLADIAAYGEGRPLSPAPQPAESGSVADDELPELPELPPQLANWLATGRWRRVQDWAATMFRRHAPQYLQEMQSTTRQMDAAVAQYQRRRNRLASLCHEAGAILDALSEQIQANREAAAAAASHADAAATEGEKEAARTRQQECEEHLAALQTQHEHQERQLEDLEMQLSAADATLARLRSQQDLLKARLQTAEARQQLAGVSRRRPPLLSRPWVLAVVVTIFVGIVSTQLLIQRAKRLSRPVNTLGMPGSVSLTEKRGIPPYSPPPPPAVFIGGTFRGTPIFRQSYTIIVESIESGYLFRTAIGGGWSPERIDAPLSRTMEWGNDRAKFSIWSDASGQPGVKLATFTASGITHDVRFCTAKRSSSPCTLAGGAEYWLIASTQGEVNWNLEASYLAGKNASRRGTAKDNWHVQPDVYVPAFTMYGLPVPQSGKREVPAATPALGPNMIVGGSSLRSPPQYSPMSCFYIRSTFEEGYLFHTASGGQWVPDRIEAPLGCSRQQGSDKVEFSLWSDAAGQPGAKLATFTASGLMYGASLCTAKLSSPSCKLAGDSPYWLVASAPHGAASWYMDMGVHHQTSALRPAGSKEQWLVRKIGNIPAFTIYGSPVGEPAPPRPASDQTGLIGDPHKVVEGVGWGAFRLGATRSELVTAYGAPSQNFDPREPSLHWRKQHIYCLIDSVRGASRLRFGKGFEIPLASGVRIGSPESQVLSAYGTTTQVLEKGPEKTLEYPSRGVEFLLTHGVVSEFTVFRPRGAVAVAHSPTSPRMKEWAKANSRMARDASLFSQKELTEVYWLALVADKRPGSEEARKAAKTLVQKYPKSSRAGGALVCLGEMSHGEEKIAYLKQAIADYSDCFFSDGVQVGAYARFLLRRAYLDSGDSEKAKALFEEIRKNYPDAIDHSGASLVIRAMPANPAAGGAALPVTVAPAEILGTTPTIGANPQLSFRCEGGVSVAATLKLFRLHGVLVRRWEIQTPKTMTLDLTGLEPDNYYLYVYAEGYLKRLTGINVSRDGVGVSSPDFMLYRKRYVVLRYASNHSGSRDLSPGKVGQRRVAVADLGEVPELRGDWRVRQQGEEVSLEFYRMQSYFGFAPAPAGATFDQLRLAPENDQYRCTNVRATPGLLLFTRIHGNNQSDACFAKIEVEQVTETPPPNVEVIARPR